MKALRWHGEQDLQLVEVDQPRAAVGEAIVAVILCGVCGTDLHEVAHGPAMIRSGPHPLTGHAPPVTLGHEFVGVLSELHLHDVPRAAALGLTVGTRVVADPTVRCGVCRWCRVGAYQQCPSSGSLGLARDGGFAESVRVPLENLYPVPDAVPDEMAALAEPLAVGLHAVTRAGVGPGDNVLVQGAGPIGLAMVLTARLAGAAQIIVSEPSAARAALAAEVGATALFDPTRDDVRREAFLVTDRIGPDAVLDATGIPEVVASSVDTVRRGGTVVVAGIGRPDLTLDARKLLFYERTLRGSLGSAYEIPVVLDALATGRLDPRPLVSDIVPLAEGGAVFDALLADPGAGAKTLIKPEVTAS
jgi:(R,R)-butanediol dehydrogenase / meso-butanediol dehydrogenase / diacetyl reductase